MPLTVCLVSLFIHVSDLQYFQTKSWQHNYHFPLQNFRLHLIKTFCQEKRQRKKIQSESKQPLTTANKIVKCF